MRRNDATVRPVGGAVHIASKASVQQLVNEPDVVMQQLSLKIFQRRQEVMESLVGQRLSYESSGSVRSGVVMRVDDSWAFLRDNDFTTRVPLKRLLL